MAKIVCITSGLTGILNASFELTDRLQKAGHECFISSPRDVKEMVQLNGFKYLQLEPINFDPAPPIPDYKGNLRKIKRLFHKFFNFRIRREQAIENLGMDTFIQQIRALNPDLVLVDIELHEHIMTLVAANQKILLLSQWFSTWKRPGLPPIESNIIPGSGFHGSNLGIRLNWLKVKLRRWKMFLKKKITSLYSDRRSILQLYAKKIGFPAKYIRENYWPGPFSYSELPVISMTLEALEFPHEKRPNLEYVGAMVYSNRKDNDAINKELEIVFERKTKENKKLIYCSVSTFKKGDLKFLKRVIKAVEKEPNFLLILSLGGILRSQGFKELPVNVYAFNQVPQLEVLKHADLSINHGGIHTINECIHFKVPMLVYSGKKSDQNGCAARVHYHSLGVMADKDLDSNQDIRERIKKVLSSSSIQQNLKLFNKLNTIYESDYKLERIIKTLIESDQKELIEFKNTH